MPKDTDDKGRPLTYDHLKKRKKPVVRNVPIVLDSELADEFEAARDEVERISRRLATREDDKGLISDLADAEDRLEALIAENEDNIVIFKLRSIGRQPLEDLIAEHGPTVDQVKAAKKKGEDEPHFNEDTYPPALVHASLIEPALELEDVIDMFDSDEWNHAELSELFMAALIVNQERRTLDLKKGSGVTRS